jgi:cytochrome c peroxidase
MKRLLIAAGTLGPFVFGAGPGSAQLPDVVPPPTAQVELGRLLFWDPILSGEQDVACATCHHPDFAYADGRDLSLGPSAVGLGPDRVADSDSRIPVVKRNAHTVLNTVYNGLSRRRRGRGRGRGRGNVRVVDQETAPMFWDNRVRSLEAQALEPIKAFEEMRGSAYTEELAVDSVLVRLRSVPEYVRLFDEAFGSVGVESETLAEALAAFQRSLLAVNSPVDRFQRGETSALSVQQQRGMRDFDEVGCDRCHGGPMFSDYRLHAEGVAENPLLATPDTSRGRFRFRTPSLRNVGLTAPYMHNGMLESLEDVLVFYDTGRSENPNVASGGRRRGGDGGPPRVDGSFRRISDMDTQQMEDIVAFLEALTDDDFDRTVPERVPSGLTPGGAIGR